MGPSLVDVAMAAAAAAAESLEESFSKPRTVSRKGEVDFVTDADLAAEGAAIATVRAALPHDEILAEEASGSPVMRTTRRWLIDPLDGTTNFLHGNPHVAVSVAVEDRRGLVVGVVHDPFRQEIFQARRGHGAWLNGRRLDVSRTATIDESLIATGFPYDRRWDPDRYLRFVSRVLSRCQGLRRAGSAALDLAWLAAGRLDAYWEWKLAPWDVGAGRLLVEEAGGVVTTIDGGPHSLTSPSLLASNSLVHGELIGILDWDGVVP